MRFGPEEKVWVVVDPKEHSTLDDIVFLASLGDPGQQFKGGLTIEENPTLFTKQGEAEIEAYGRLTALRTPRQSSEAGSDRCTRTRSGSRSSTPTARSFSRPTFRARRSDHDQDGSSSEAGGARGLGHGAQPDRAHDPT